MPSTSPVSSSLPTVSSRTEGGVTHIDLDFASAMAKGSGAIFVTDGAVQTVIDRATGQPTLRVVGASFTKEIALSQVSISGTHVLFDAAGLPPGARLNVYMGAGTLLSDGNAYGAITVPGSASFTTPAAEPPPPGLDATIELDGNSLKSGEDIFVTITFSRPVAELPPAALSAANAAISHLATHDGGKTWVATLSGQAATDAPSNVLRLDLDSVVAADGSRGNGVVESSSYLVDTLVAAYVGSGIDMGADTGPYRDDGVTNEDTMSLSGLRYGDLKPGESIELVINGRTIDAGLIVHTKGALPGTWEWHYSNDAEHFKPGENTVQVRVVGNGHASQLATKTILVERDAPHVVSAPAGLVDAGQSISIGFDEAMYWHDNVEVNQDIRVVDDLGNTSWINLDESHLSADGKTLTLSAAEHNLATGNTYRLYLPGGLTDLAGNGLDAPAIGFTTSGPYQDKAPPRLVQLYIANGSGTYGVGDVLEFRLRFSEKVKLEAGTEATLDLDNGKLAAYGGLANDGREMIFTYTVAAGDNVEALRYVAPSWTLFGHVRDDVGNVFQNAHVEYDGLTTEDGYGALVSIDTVVAQPGKPQLHAESEASAPGDGSTADTRPRLTGSGAEQFATISIYEGDARIGTAVADGNGHWDTVVVAPLSHGSHQITVIQEDRAGNVSALSEAFSLTIVPPPSLAAPVLVPGSDSGVSDSDGITHADQPAISGKGPANATLALWHNGAAIAELRTDANGDWDYTLAPLPDGEHSFSVRLDGTSLVSPTLSITVDGANPRVMASPDGAAHFNPDSAIVITFDEAVHIATVGGDGDMLVLVDENDAVQKIALGEAMLSSDGRTLTIAAADHSLLAGTGYRVQLPATLTDLAGNGMGEYQIQFSTGNALLPTATTAIVSGAHGGYYGDPHSYRTGDVITFRVRFNEAIEKIGNAELSLGLSNGAHARFTGIGGAGNDEAVFTYTVGANENLQDVRIIETTLAGNIADLSGNVLDAAHIEFSGLYDDSGYGTWIDIDSVAPDALERPLLDVASNSGNQADQLTKDRTPTLAGTGAEPGARIELYEGDTLLGYGEADGEGNWEVSVEAAGALADDTHVLTVRQVDQAGNRSLPSAALSVTIDATVAELAAPRLKDGYDTGKSGTDNLTRENEPVLAGSGAEAGARIQILSGDTVVGSGHADADADGNWSADLFFELSNGEYSFTVRQEDEAGNLSTASSELVFTVDLSPPNPPGTPALVPESDSGTLGDGLTNLRTPTLRGSNADAGAELVLYVDGREVGRPVADASGNWTFAIPAAHALSEGLRSIQLTQLDAAGNESGLSDAFDLRIDTIAAPPPSPTLAASSDSGISNSDGITNDVTPTFSGSGAEAGATIVLYADAREIGRKVVDDAGNWDLTVLEADRFTTNGNFAVTARQIDLAGNTSDASTAFDLVIDTLGPNLSSAGTNRALREFQLAFNEKVSFHPSGNFDLKDDSSLLGFFRNDSANWYTSSGAGGADSVLNLKISLNGLFNLTMNNNAIQDVAGNVALIGTREWLVDLLSS